MGPLPGGAGCMLAFFVVVGMAATVAGLIYAVWYLLRWALV